MRVTIRCPDCGNACGAESSLLPRNVVCPACRWRWWAGGPAAADAISSLGIDTAPSTFVPNRRPAILARRLRSRLLAGVCVLAASLIAWLVVREATGLGPDPRRWLPAAVAPLSPEQGVVRAYLLARANKPESVWFEKWYPVAAEPSGLVPIDRFRKANATHVVRVIWRMTLPLVGEVRQDAICLIDGGKPVGWALRPEPGFDFLRERYYPDDEGQ